ncbi:MAG: hypothetical protein SVM86_02130 [Candidatus Cloacimonadota bacterium]|nr:hypothetical protein [Candidatus Cloacimonadota bacterium]
MKKLPYFYLLELGELVAAKEGCRVSVMVGKPKIKENISKFNALPAIQEYKLTAEEVLLIAICCQAYDKLYLLSDNYTVIIPLEIANQIISKPQTKFIIVTYRVYLQVYQ